MTKLYFVNRFILQFFFIRLTRHIEHIIHNYEVIEISQVNGGGLSINGKAEIKNQQWYSIQYFVIPFTGWTTDFRYINGKHFLPLTKPKLIK